MKFISFLPALCWWLLTLALFTLPGSTFPKNPFYALVQLDKWVHAFLFFTLCFLIYRPFIQKKIPAGFYHWFIAVAACFYGVIIEFVQEYLVVNRSFDKWDIVADAAGCGLAYLWFSKRCKKVDPRRNGDRNQN